MTTTVVYSDSSDGTAQEAYSAGSGVPWSTIRSGAGTDWVRSTFNDGYAIYIRSDNNLSPPDYWRILARSIFSFDTSFLGSDAVSSAELELYGKSKQDALSISPDINIFSSSSIGSASSFADIGSAPFSTAVSYSGWSTSSYNSFVLNSSGRSHINKSGDTYFATKNENYDNDNVAPTWTSTKISYLEVYFTEEAGTSFDPKITIEHTPVISEDITETITLVEGFTWRYILDFLLSITLAETLTKNIDRLLKEVIPIILSFSRVININKSFEEVIALVQSFVTAPAKVFSETITLVEDFAKTATKNIEESLSLVQSYLMTISKSFSEVVVLVDTFEALSAFLQEMTETILVTPTLTKLTETIFTEDVILNLNDTLSFTVSKAFDEAVTLVEAFTPNRIFDEVITVVDSISNQVDKIFLESVTVVESIAKSITTGFDETITLVESLVAAISKTFTEVIVLVDVLVKSATKLITETLTLPDAFSRIVTFNKAIDEVISLVESFTALLAIDLLLEETISMVDKWSGIYEGLRAGLWRKINKDSTDFTTFLKP